jgi:hypothetical protein
VQPQRPSLAQGITQSINHFGQICESAGNRTSSFALDCALRLSLEGASRPRHLATFRMHEAEAPGRDGRERKMTILVRLRADIDSAVDAISRFVPVYLAGFEFELSALNAIAVLNRQKHCHAGPPLSDGTGRDATGCLTGRQAQWAHEGCPTTVQHLLGHRHTPWAMHR